MRTRDLIPKRSIENHKKFYLKIEKEISSSKIKMKNARLKRGLYKPFYSEFKVLLDYANLKYDDKENIFFKWVGHTQQGKKINYDGEIYDRNGLLEKVEITCPLSSVLDRIVEQELNEIGSVTIEIENMKNVFDVNNSIIESVTKKKNSMHTYDDTITLVIYMENMKYYFSDMNSYKKSLKNLAASLKKISYQFKEVFIVENLFMYDKKNLIKIK